MTASAPPPDDPPAADDSADTNAVAAADAVSNAAAETPAGGPPAADGGYLPDDPLTGHSYDGIEEYDNPMPAWWKNVFWATIIFSVLYAPIVYSQLLDAGVLSRYERAKVANIRLQFADLGELTADGPTVARFVGDERWEAVGESIYQSHCVSCHGTDALGLVGPNLRDEQYKHISKIGDVPKVLLEGAANGSMPAWQNRLSENEIVMASAYVAGLRGTAGGAGKAPEGREIPPWDLPVGPADAEPAVQ
ncbi:cbb3-type cytochrome c oxidase N-terminal domain-containing protein [Alienimonas sp. DA493]|uniref:cbb3-type cytochrome c oxidase N-terminal domain-containing protein n=1 Tax=Alienimonas sp. DA493 TaxID=3373605 RepID=UPI003754B49A